MYLSKVQLDPRSKEARRDLADPYQLHATICRAFTSPETKCPEGEFLWRLEPEIELSGCPCILVQSRSIPQWERISLKGWFEKADSPLNLEEKLHLDDLKAGQHFRFRLRANPCVSRQGKRIGLFRLDDQEKWMARKGDLHGFSLPLLKSFDHSESHSDRIDVRISQEQMVSGYQHAGNGIRVFSVLFDGILTVTDPGKFREALRTGIGHGKVMGLGLLSIVQTS